MLNRILKFTVTFIIAAYSPLIFICTVSQKMPVTEKIFELLGSNLIFSVGAYFLAVLLSKKGNPASVITFGAALFIINIVFLIKII